MSVNGKASFIGGVIFGFLGLVATLFIGGQILGGAFDAPVFIKYSVAAIVNVIIGLAGYAIIFRWLLARGAVALPGYKPARPIYYLIYAACYGAIFFLFIYWATHYHS